MIRHEVEPRSPEWHALRIGLPTASEFSKIITPKTGKPSDSALPYMYELLAELMLGREIETVETHWMIRGTEMEDAAIKCYEYETGTETDRGGFITDDLVRYGCSPDRIIVGKRGDLEIKCPKPNTHVGYLVAPESLAAGYAPQIQGRMFIQEYDFVDVMSYHPELPSVIYRVARDEVYITALATALGKFCDTLASMRESLEAIYGKFPEIAR